VVLSRRSELRDRLDQWVGRRVGIDTRALAALRIGLGTLLLVDLVLRARSLGAFYTDSGVLSRAVLEATKPGYHLLSLHTLSGALWAQALLFVIAGIAALALLVGYRTRTATLVSVVLLVSLHARNPLLLNGGDTLLRRLLFWALFLPLGERFAVDTIGEDTPRETVSGLATAGLLCQVVAIYVVNAVIKLRSDTWLSGRALRLVFDLDQFTVFAGDLVAAAGPVLPVLGWLWLALLVVSPLLIGLTGRARAALAGCFVVGHAGMVATIGIGVFPLVSIVALLPFLSESVWHRIWPDEPRALQRLSAVLPTGTVRRPAAPAVARLRTPLLALALAGLLVSNAATVGALPAGGSAVPEQSWDMFAPTPPLTDGWFVAPGATTDGRQIDAFTGESLRWDRPPDLETAYPSARWRKYMMGLRSDDTDPYREGLARHLCQRWDRSHERDLQRVGIVFVAEPTRVGEPDPQRRESLGQYRCP